MRNVVRHVVKFGHLDAFFSASAVLNERCLANGIPAYRVFTASWSPAFNEIYAELEIESAGVADALFSKAFNDDPAFGAAMREVFSHVVDGMSHDYMLTEVELPT